MMHFHAQLWAGQGGTKKERGHRSKGGHTDRAKQTSTLASKCLSLLLESKIHFFGLNCAKPREKFVTNLKGEMFPDEPSPPFTSIKCVTPLQILLPSTVHVEERLTVSHHSVSQASSQSDRNTQLGLFVSGRPGSKQWGEPMF